MVQAQRGNLAAGANGLQFNKIEKHLSEENQNNFAGVLPDEVLKGEPLRGEVLKGKPRRILTFPGRAWRGSQLPAAIYPLQAEENSVFCQGKGAYGNLQWLCRFGCQTKVQFLEKYEKTKRFIICSSKVLGKTPKMTPGDPKNEKIKP